MILAEATAQWVGKQCTECHGPINTGDRIFKVPAEGATTRHGQGPGRWIGKCCYSKFVEQTGFDFEEDQ